MRKVVVATHAKLAEGFLSTLKMIMGEQENIKAICAYLDETFDLDQEIQKEISLLKEEDELIIATDLFGGSVNNTLMKYINDQVHLVAGINFPFLVQLCVSDDCTPIEDVIQVSMEESKNAFVYCNELVKEYMKLEG